MRYSAQVLARISEPSRVGALPAGDPDVGVGETGSPDEGTWVRISIRVGPGAERISEARFKAFGCSAALASASLVAERLEGERVSAARAMTAGDIVAALDLAPERASVARLAVEAGRRAIEAWEAKTIEAGRR